jgi:hypothetical protein
VTVTCHDACVIASVPDNGEQLAMYTNKIQFFMFPSIVHVHSPIPKLYKINFPLSVDFVYMTGKTTYRTMELESFHIMSH